jgi:hypothetical protein
MGSNVREQSQKRKHDVEAIGSTPYAAPRQTIQRVRDASPHYEG